MLKKKLGLKNLFRRRTKTNGVKRGGVVKRGGISLTNTDSTACSSPGRGIGLAAFDVLAIDRLPDRSGRSGLLETTSFDVPNIRSMVVLRKTVSESGMDEYSVIGDEVDRYFVSTESIVSDGFTSESVATEVTMDCVSDLPSVIEAPSEEDSDEGSVDSLVLLMQHMICCTVGSDEESDGAIDRLPDRSGRSGLLETTSLDVPNIRPMVALRKTISESGMDEYSAIGDDVDRYFVRTELVVPGSFASESDATGVTMDCVSDLPTAIKGPSYEDSDEDSVDSLVLLMQHWMCCTVVSDEESEPGQVEMKLTKDSDEKESLILSVMNGFCT